jgi:DNA-binding transcriptional regulator GbsR (MarR family)
MNILNRFLELFRKKDFYVIDYNSLNNFSIAVNEIKDKDIDKLKYEIDKFKDASSIEEKKGNLFKDASIEIQNIERLIEEVKNTITEDYRTTNFEAVQKKWDFNYFLTDYQKIYNDTLFICNRLKSSVDDSLGETMYPILAIRKLGKRYYFWNLLDKR